MLLVTGLNGETERLVDYKNVRRKWRVNGEHSLSFLLLNTERVQHAYDLVSERSKITDKYGDEYIVRGISEDGHWSKQITAMHIFFDQFSTDHQYNLLNGYTNFKQCMDFIFNGTGWSWVSQGAFAATEFQNFGDKKRLVLLQTALNRYEAELEINNKTKTITFKNQIGQQTDAQFRYGYNLKTFNKDIDMNSFFTIIRGYGKDSNEKEIMVEYKSPMLQQFGPLVQDPIRDERFKSTDTLMNACKNTISDIPDIKFKVSVANLIENGLPAQNYNYGDYVYMLYEKANIAVSIRIIEKEDDPTDDTVAPVVELSTFKQLKSMSAIQAQFQQTQSLVKQLTDDGGNLNLALKRLYRNSNHFSDNTGDWYISPDDPNAYVHIGAGGLDVHRGLVRVEREDGYATIIGGILQHGFDINGHEPPFTAVNVEGWWWVTDKSDEHYDCQYYTFEHKSRYLNVLIGQLATEGASCEVAIMAGDGNTFLAKYASNNTDPKSPIAVYGKLYEIDLGVPTGEEMSVYIRLRSTVEGKKAYCRKIRMWLDR
ncbi:phage tail protein [Bacillus paranthracis]|uniref:Phage tail protein n=1 Tax=Bacillus paranthracis TaxID=2026186 RepID=A0AAX3QK90_9BACI|nr:phage tail protein [Bacillus paranthracis]WES09732.1 phage tail protein [Bacillus paranthracis]